MLQLLSYTYLASHVLNLLGACLIQHITLPDIKLSTGVNYLAHIYVRLGPSDGSDLFNEHGDSAPTYSFW